MKQWSVVRRSVMGMGLAWLIAIPASPVAGAAPDAWPFHLEWDHDGQSTSFYQLCTNGQCTTLEASRTAGDGWRAPMPMLSPGEYRLVLEACGQYECVQGAPDMMIRVVGASARRLPIDVIDGPSVRPSRR